MKEFLNLPLSAVMRDWRIWLISALFLAVGILAINDTLVYNPDSARYLVWAQSLSHIHGFTDLSIPEPFHYVVHAPLYPVLLVPAALLAPGSVMAAKITTLLLGVTLLVLLYWWLRERVSKGLAMMACLVFATNPLMILFSNQVLSDIPFTVAIVASFLILERRAPHSDEKLQVLLPLAGILTAGVFLREVGITLYFAAVLYFLARKEYRSALFIFIIPMIFYLLWFLRNEIIVAGADHPPLRNSEIFTLHYFTDRQASLLEELAVRLKINASIYWNHILNLVFLPQYATTPYGVFIRSAPPFSTAMAVAGPLHIVIAFVTLGAAAYGVFTAAKNNPSTPFFLAFVPVYLLLIFFYPFNDIRFLFPMLLFFIYYGTLGLGALMQLPLIQSYRNVAASVAITMVLVLMVPNLAWTFAFARDNARYRSSPEALYESVVHDPSFPDLLTKPTSVVGAWLQNHQEGPVNVLTQWKELTFWFPAGKLIEVNTLTPMDEFERLIRDYRIGFVVSAMGLAGIPEFYAQMALSTRYRFDSVFRVANLEVFRVTPSETGGGVSNPGGFGGDTTRLTPEVRRLWTEQLKGRRAFVRGLQAIAAGEIDTAKAILGALSVKTRGSLIVILHLAIAHEFAGEYDAAQELLRGLQLVKQSGAFLGHSTDHLEIISLLERAKWEKKPPLKAEYYNVVSIKLWGLGFRRQALDALDRSLEADPEFFPGLIFGIYFNLQENRLNVAWGYFRRLMLARPGHPLITQFQTILSFKDSLQRKLPLRQQSEYHLRIAEALRDAGLGDGAIDELIAWLKSDPGDEGAWKMLSSLYTSRFRYEPSLRAAQEAVRINPSDPEAKDMRAELESRW